MTGSLSPGARQAGFSVRRADWSRDREALRAIRECVFVREQSVPAELEWDGGDECAIHLLAVDADGESIGTARLLPSGQIGRMAVLPEWRRRGVGSALLEATLAIANEPGQPAPFLNAQTAVIDFYQRQGFVPEGGEFMEAGIPHRRMVLTR
ncbi:MAG: GNAT family N-acetyltransferase [Chromatiaceae bacterium]|nr:GNAT family N-acetyltransferase [Chromatiaceae bacterium]